MPLWHALVFGLVEGITEFLPISSTGHLMLTARALGYSQTEFLKSFEIAIQLGAILAVVVLYGKRFLFDFNVWAKIAAAFFPTAVIGFALHKIVKQYLLESHATVLGALFTGGLVLIIFEILHREKEAAVGEITQIPWVCCVLIGVFQALAMIPGVSRSAATIVGGLILGLQRRIIVEFSFLLAVPTLLAATGLDILKTGVSLSVNEIHFLAGGFFAAFIFAILSIKFLVSFIQKHNFVSFGIYRMLVSAGFWFFDK